MKFTRSLPEMCQAAARPGSPQGTSHWARGLYHVHLLTSMTSSLDKLLHPPWLWGVTGPFGVMAIVMLKMSREAAVNGLGRPSV